MRTELSGKGKLTLDLLAAAFALILAVACVFQFNQYPLERFPNWDAFWVDTQTVAYLGALRDALMQGTIPIVGPYTNFGWYSGGDTTLIASAFNPIHWLVLVMDPVHVIVVRTVAYFSIAAFGVYLYFSRVFNEPIAGFAAAAAYLALPMNYTLLYHSNMIGFAYFTPILFVMIHRVIENRGRFAWFWFAVWAAISTASSDVYGLVALPVVIGAYTFFVLLRNLRESPYRLFLIPLGLLTLWLAASSFYVVPFSYNILQNSDFARSAGLAPGTPMSAAGFWAFLKNYVLWGGFVKPVDTVSIILYVPFFIYSLLAVSLVLGWVFFDQRGRQRLWIVLALLGTAVVLFLESFVFYSIPSLAASATGLLRVQIKLYSYLVTIASFICFAEWVRFAVAKRLEEVRYSSVARKVVSLLALSAVFIVSRSVDMNLFADNAPPVASDPFAIVHVVNEPFQSSNFFQIPVQDVWPLLVNANLFFFLFSASAILSFRMIGNGVRSRMSIRNIPLLIASVSILGIGAICLYQVSIHNDSRLQQGRWAYETNSDYRIRTFHERRDCVDQLTGSRADPEFRTLYAGRMIYGEGHQGRNWKAIAETELNVLAHEKVLFPYRNTIHPFTAIARNAFGDSQRMSNLWPVTASSVAMNLDLARFLGVRWIISNDEEIDQSAVSAGALIALGSCAVEEPPIYTEEPYQGGETFVYEIPSAQGISFVAPRQADLVTAAQDGPAAGAALLRQIGNEKVALANAAKITAEGYGNFTVEAVAPGDGGKLFLSVVNRPHWSAEINGEKVEIQPAFGGFMSVELRSGRNTIAFVYRPYEVLAGIGTSVLALMLAFGAAFIFRNSGRWGSDDVGA